MKLSSAGASSQSQEGEKKCLNSELWHACAGPLVSLPSVGSHVVYFPQGHSEQVTASTNREVDAQIPNYPSLPPQLICQLHDLTMHADIETDEVYAQMTLQPLSPEEQKEIYLPAELGAPSKQPTNYFCKTLTASDTSTHGGFSVPRRAAEKVFPPLDFSQQPPCQELIARDLHDNEWKFRHIFRGQPKRHLLTTGWSVFVSAKRLVAGDSVLFIWNEKNQLLLGIRRANRPQTVMPSSVLSSDSMHLGLLAAAAHAAATNSRFTIFYNPRASPSEFVIPLAKYLKAVYHSRVSVGMRFRMLFETEESTVRRYMGTITGISDLDPVRWPNSLWRSVKVGWDESTAGERQPRVSLWEVEPLTTFPMYPSPFSLGLKRPWPSGLPSLYGIRNDDLIRSQRTWFPGDNRDCGLQSVNFQGLGINPWGQLRIDTSGQTDMHQAMALAALQEMRPADPSKQVISPCLPVQQSQIVSGSSSLVDPQLLRQSQPQYAFLQGVQGSHLQGQLLCQSQSPLLSQQLQHSDLLKNQQKQQQQEKMMDHQQILDLGSKIPQFASASQSQAPLLQSVPLLCHQQSFLDSHVNPMSNVVVSSMQCFLNSEPEDQTSQLLNIPKSNPMIESASWPRKRQAVEPLLTSVASQSSLHLAEQSESLQMNNPLNTVSLLPFPGKECSLDHDGSTDPHVLFGASIDSSPLLMQGGISSLKAATRFSDSMTIPFSSSNMLGPVGTDYGLNPMMTSSSSIHESGLLHSTETLFEAKPPTPTFVKVYKSGSFGRSLDISKFSSYQELRSELAHMFGLDGQLEDPLRSGWQLVFVDKENDVLLLGDDPWMEFVNNVWCIKILSPQEIQQMGKQGLELLNSVPLQRILNANCEGYSSQQDARSLSAGITCMGSLDY